MKINNDVKNMIKWAVLFICLIGFLLIAEDVYEKELMKKDIIGYYLVSTFLISDFATPIAKIITNFGGAMCLILITVAIFIFVKNKRIGIAVAFNLVIATTLNVILKNILQRPRPNEFRMIDETGYSFPSGHSMISMAFYGFLIYLIYKYVKNENIKLALISLLCLLIPAIGISRIYLGVHYTSDVLAGFLIAISYLIVYSNIVKKFLLERKSSYGKENSK